MFKLALVQNISEMRNYSYADLRKDLVDLGFELASFTRENIDRLGSILDPDKTDCVIFATNAFNDKNIYQHVTNPKFAEAFKSYLDNGGACLLLHQNNLKGVENPFPFIDDSILRLESSYAEKYISLNCGEGSVEAYFTFPNKISIDEITDTCYKNTAVSGKYWLLMRASEGVWSPIMTDSLGNAVISKHNSRKMIFSSLLLDYQKHVKLLYNVLINLLSDNHSLAILQRENNDTLGFSYFLNSLENNKFYYKKYTVDDESVDDLIKNARLGIHSTILVNQELMASLPARITDIIEKYGVKLIEINDKRFEKSDSFTVHSTDKSLALTFSKLELQIQEDLSRGFILGSFMKTVEMLDKLKEFECEGMTAGKYDKQAIAHVLELMSPHLKEDGSYDETFGATCKAHWIFYHFLGQGDALTRAAYSYIKKNKDVSSVREILERHSALSLSEANRQKYLADNCSDVIRDVIDSRFEYITEYDFIKILKIAIEIGDERMLCGLSQYVKDNVSEGGELFNSYVTAIVASYMIDMYSMVSDRREKEHIRELLFDMVLYLRRINLKRMPLEEALQTVCTLYKFETVVSFPIDDLTEIIFKTGNFPHEYHTFENQIHTYQKTRLEIDTIENENRELRAKSKALGLYKISFFVLLSLSAVFLYLCVYLAITLSDSGVPLVSTIIAKIKESWPSLFSLLIIPLISFLYNKYIKNKKEKEE